MSDQTIDYEEHVQNALRHVMNSVLTRVASEGLPGDHHFYITFNTTADGVIMPDFLREQYPQEMTVVLQSQYWNLAVRADAFDVDLKFNGNATALTVPFDAVLTFVDPSVQFALQFNEGTDIEGAIKAEDASIFSDPTSFLEAEVGSEASKPHEAPAASTVNDGDNVVTLDAFRKK